MKAADEVNAVVTHPQAILKAVIERSDLTPSERLEAQEAMFYSLLEVALESVPSPEVAARVWGEK